MNEPDSDAVVGQATELSQASRRRTCLLVLLLANWLVLCALLFSMLTWLQLQWLATGLFFGQAYMLSFWGAWRGGSLLVRLGASFLAVVVGGWLAFQMIAAWLPPLSIEVNILPVPLGVMYLLGVALLLPFGWWNGKSLIFPGEEAPLARPRQFRIHHFVLWTLLVGLALGLAGAAMELAKADIFLVLVIPMMLLYLGLLSIPIVRGVFSRTRPVLWSGGGFLLVISFSIVLGTIGCILWQGVGMPLGWREVSFVFVETISFHAAAGLCFLANLAVIRRLGGEFRGRDP